MIDIDNQTDIWSKTKYKDIKLDKKIVDPKYFDLVWSSFLEMGIYDKFMNGNSVESLPRNDQSENLNGPKFSNAFHELNNKNQISPGLYLAFIVNQFMNGGNNKVLLTGYLSRALRSFASFMREPDLAYKLKAILEKDDKSVVVNMDPKQDIKKHVDIVINFKEHTFNLWSYQATRRGLPNTLDRLSGNRGEVCDGINILCPLRTEDAQVLVKKNIRIYVRKSANVVEKLSGKLSGKMNFLLNSVPENKNSTEIGCHGGAEKRQNDTHYPCENRPIWNILSLPC